ncbi:conjugative transposon protein TraN [Mucilaginibacter gynuensis]|uniref:Conjugative transposon protein TraN n=1 Tax=Mucilaginibacter gynuensis TaxID=1302236 RepID=A0ABP8GZK7_9SPHI
MKNIMYYLLWVIGSAAHGQGHQPTVYLPHGQTLHFLSPEPIQYVDISTKALVGDLPLKHVLRIRLKDSVSSFSNAVVTIAGEKFIIQYHLQPGDTGSTQINIDPRDTRPLDIADIGFSQNQLKMMALRIFAGKPGNPRKTSKSFGVTATLNRIFTAGDYVFLDITYRNDTRLNYAIEEIRFRIDDEKVTKASNIQSFELQPVFALFDVSAFRKNYRNVFAFKKMSFPGNKQLVIELSEKQISGRILILRIPYQDILQADTLSD